MIKTPVSAGEAICGAVPIIELGERCLNVFCGDLLEGRVENLTRRPNSVDPR